jgi:pyrroline-5-carboxylate reductase
VDVSKHRLVVIGGGNMGAALVGGLIAADWEPSDLGVVERLPARAAQLAGLFPGVTIVDEVGPAEAVLVAVKPPDVGAAVWAAVEAGATRVLSIAAGVSLTTLSGICGPGVAIVRGMPNTPALLGKGASAVTGGPDSSEADLVWAEEILGAVGTVVRVTEPQLDIVTSLAGSGPAFLFLVAEALVDAGVTAGLPRAIADDLVRQLYVGSAALLAEDGRAAPTLRGEVTSPGGVTAAGLRVLEQKAVRSSFLEAVLAGTERSRELGLGNF